MRVVTDIETNTIYGLKKINKIEIFGELDEHSNLIWKLEGQHGLEKFPISFHENREEAVRKFAEIQCRLLLAQEREADLRK